MNPRVEPDADAASRVSSPPIGARRLFWPVCAIAVAVGAVGVIGPALRDSAAPSLETVRAVTGLHYPVSTEVVEADLTDLRTPAPGAVGEVTVAVPAEDFGDFVDGNDMEAPVPSGAAPTGEAVGIIPSGCGERVCYSGGFVVEDGTVTIDLTVALL